MICWTLSDVSVEITDIITDDDADPVSLQDPPKGEEGKEGSLPSYQFLGFCEFFTSSVH